MRRAEISPPGDFWYRWLNLHFAIVSLMEELDAIDWYRQRADDAEDETLKELLLHNMRKEWSTLRCCWSDSDFERLLKTYLFTEGSILQQGRRQPPGAWMMAGQVRPQGAPKSGFTIGSLKDG
jgi:uncharacterized protein